MPRRGRPAKTMDQGMMMEKGMMPHDKMMGMGWMSCCGSSFGLIHLLGGAGIALLVVSYFSVADTMFWGWVLVGVALVGHLWKMMMWKKW